MRIRISKENLYMIHSSCTSINQEHQKTRILISKFIDNNFEEV
jgi:hypothetical protein